MDIRKFKTILSVGETVAVEFKRCGNGISADTYETVCSFLNRYGGDLFLGVENDGTVTGIPANAAPDVIKNFIKMVSNPDVLSPTVYLSPEIMEYEGKKIVRVHVPPSSEVHTCKRTIYDRVDDADVRVTATGQIAALYIRKQKIFTEKKIYPYVRDEHLRLDMLPRLRQMAVNRYRDHPWQSLSDSELLQSAGLTGEDMETGDKGYNLAAIMLLGKDNVIKNVCPAYRTDALLKKINVDRYDDRLIVQTNLIDSYELLMGFAAKHMLDKFYLEGDARFSLSRAISREMLVNCLIHREMTSSFFAKFIIEKERMFTENANRAVTGDVITPDNFEPNPKNPIIASFFRNIGLADELGSGVRNLFRYGKLYTGQEPRMIDGDVFRIIVPLDDNYSFDAQIGMARTANREPQTAKKPNRENCGLRCGTNCAPTELDVLNFLKENPSAAHEDIANAIGKSVRTAQSVVRSLKQKGLLIREGARNNGHWAVK
jgi:ATP-dependent DNA helicase RecG